MQIRRSKPWQFFKKSFKIIFGFHNIKKRLEVPMFYLRKQSESNKLKWETGSSTIGRAVKVIYPYFYKLEIIEINFRGQFWRWKSFHRHYGFSRLYSTEVTFAVNILQVSLLSAYENGSKKLQRGVEEALKIIIFVC